MDMPKDYLTSLPLELITMVVERLEEDAADPSRDCLVPAWRQVYLTWTPLTYRSLHNICDARLVCRKLYNASLKSFGKVLGDRRFRLTKTGMDDLTAISQQAHLLPYIHTLTIGQGGPGVKYNVKAHKGVHVCSPEVSEDVHNSLIATYNAEVTWQQTHPPDSLVTQLASVLGIFASLENIRFVMRDCTTTEPDIGGWSGVRSSSFYRPSLFTVAPNVLSALSQTSTRIKDRRFVGPLSSCHDLVFSLLLEKHLYQQDALIHFDRVRVLHISVRCRRVTQATNEKSSTQFIQYLKKSTELEELSVSLDDVSCLCATCIRADGSLLRAQCSQQLLEALGLSSRLRRLELLCGWAFNERDLTDFMAGRPSSLRSFTLTYPYLIIGKWQGVLHNIATATQADFDFLDVRWPAEIDFTDNKFKRIDLLPEELPSFSHDVDLDFPYMHEQTS